MVRRTPAAGAKPEPAQPLGDRLIRTVQQRTEHRRVQPGMKDQQCVFALAPSRACSRGRARNRGSDPELRARPRTASGVRPRRRAASSVERAAKMRPRRASSAPVHARAYVARPSFRARAAIAVGVRCSKPTAISLQVKPSA